MSSQSNHHGRQQEADSPEASNVSEQDDVSADRWEVRLDIAKTVLTYALAAAAIIIAAAAPFAAERVGGRFAEEINEREVELAKELSNRELGLSYVQVAVDILSRCPAIEMDEEPDLTPGERALRSWAVEVLDENSPVPLNAVAEDLKTCSARLSPFPGFPAGSPSSLDSLLAMELGLVPQVQSGPLPAGCNVVVHATPDALFVPLFDEPNTSSLSAGVVSPGMYEAVEFQSANVPRVSGWFRITAPDGWVPAENAQPATEQCFE